MEVFSYAMAQPYKIILSMKPEEVKDALDKFWNEKGDEMMKNEPGGWTMKSAFREHMEKKHGVKLYYDTIWGWVEVGAPKSGLRVENINAINVDKLSEKDGGIISVVVNVVPKVKLGDYKNIKITAPPMTASDKEVDSQIFLALNHSTLASTTELDKDLEEGDMVRLSYVCKRAGTDEVVDSRENITVSLRKGQGAALTTELIGEHTNQDVTKEITLPDNFPKKDLAGQKVVCEFKIGPVIIRNLPTEEQEASQLGMTVQEWRGKVKADIEKNKQETFDLRRKDFIRTEVEKVLLSTSEIEPLPDSMIEKEADALLKSLAAARDKSVEEYLKDMNMNNDDAFRQMAPMAMRRIMVKLIVDSIAAQEGMEVDEAKRDEYLHRYSEETGKPFDEVKKGFEGADINFLVKTFMVDELLCNSTIILPAPELNVVKIGDPTTGTLATEAEVQAKVEELSQPEAK